MILNIFLCNLSIDCSYIEGAKPMQFINLMATNIKSFNLKPTIAHKIFNDINI